MSTRECYDADAGFCEVRPKDALLLMFFGLSLKPETKYLLSGLSIMCSLIIPIVTCLL